MTGPVTRGTNGRWERQGFAMPTAAVHRSGIRDNERRAQVWIALALCAAVSVAWAMGQLAHNRPDYAERFAPAWLPLAAAGLAAVGIVLRLDARRQWLRLGRALSWGGLLLMVWAAGGLVIDLLRVAGRVAPGLMPHEVDWAGLATRTVALAAAVVLARLALADSPDPASASEVGSTHVVSWYGYAAFALALPYPVLKTCWVLGVSLGLLCLGKRQGPQLPRAAARLSTLLSGSRLGGALDRPRVA